MPKEDFSRLASAMVVNKEFAAKVMDPQTRIGTINAGYLTEKFGFTGEELELLAKVAAEEKDPFKKLGKFWTEVNKLREESNL